MEQEHTGAITTGIIVSFLLGLWCGSALFSRPVPMPYPVGDSEIEKCTNFGGEFNANDQTGGKVPGGFVATCSHPAQVVNY